AYLLFIYVLPRDSYDPERAFLVGLGYRKDHQQAIATRGGDPLSQTPPYHPRRNWRLAENYFI
ncbi:hypothetical protein J6590_062940, partial [Homalodisca vitripennis]